MKRPEVEEVVQFMKTFIAPVFEGDACYTIHAVYIRKKMDSLAAYIQHLEDKLKKEVA